MLDSSKQTLGHIEDVRNNIRIFTVDLAQRGIDHDASKLRDPEKYYFDNAPDISKLEYGTEEYKASCLFLKPAIDHHYAHNSHHPQYYENGINGMNLFDIVEMFCDWRAATKRNLNGDIMKSIEINAERFGMSKQLKSIFINTENYIRENERKD